jgi:hypothetical protein
MVSMDPLGTWLRTIQQVSIDPGNASSARPQLLFKQPLWLDAKPPIGDGERCLLIEDESRVFPDILPGFTNQEASPDHPRPHMSIDG